MEKALITLILSSLVMGLNASVEIRQTIDLNGTWKAHENKSLTCDYPPPKNGWVDDTIPHKKPKFIRKSEMNWHISSPPSYFKEKGLLDIDDRGDISAWYQRSFKMPDKMNDKVAWLTFNCVYIKSVVWLNGTKLGECVTGSAPTSYDITKRVRWGQENTVTVWLAGPESIVDIKNDMYVAPNPHCGAGIFGDVNIQIMDRIHIDDVFVKTSVKNKKIELEMTISNQSDQKMAVIPSCVVKRFNNGYVDLEIIGKSVDLNANETKMITISKEWKNPVLWSPDAPFLYVADCRLSNETGKVLDEFSQRFGFREFEVKGRGFLLNGKPFTLLRACSHSYPNSDYSDIYGMENPMNGNTKKNLISHPFNNYRVWGTSPLVPNMGDEMGVTLAPTLSRYLPPAYPVDPDKRAIWLPVFKKELKKVVKNLRNHPSIIIWNMANETYWGNVPENPEMKAVCEEMVDVVRSVDSTRPLDGDAEVGWDGLLDIISIHYPKAPGELCKKYPNSGYVIPNDLYWLKDKGNTGWRANFDWDKPLSIGEYSGIGAQMPDGNSCFGGEKMYDWTFQNKNKYGKKWLAVKQLSMLADVYRSIGVACINPWHEDGNAIMPRFGVRPLDFHPNFFGGETVDRKFVVFFESNTPLHGTRLQCLLTVDGKDVWEKSIPVKIKRGANVFDVPITPPNVAKTTKAELCVRLRYGYNKFKPVKASHLETVFIMPRSTLKGFDNSKIALFDPTGKTADKLSKLGLDIKPAKSLDQATLTGKKVLLIAGDAPLNDATKSILDFAEKGGSVILLQRSTADILGLGYPEIDKSHVTSRTWKRTFDHPILEEVDNGQLSFWRPDNLVGKLNYSKPIDGDYNVLLDAGGLRGLEWTPLCETTLGKGHILFSQLSLMDRLDVEPMAADMLKRMIKYGLDARPSLVQPLRLLSKDNGTLEEILKLCHIVYKRGLKEGTGPVLWDATYKAAKNEIEEMKKFVAAGGKIWMHNFTPANVAETASLLPFEPKLSPINPKITTAVRVSDSPLMNNLSNADFLWAKIILWDRGDYHDSCKPTAKLGSYALELPNLQTGEPLLNPALLTQIPEGKGAILFDTLNWEGACETEGERVIRIVSALAMNLGAKIAKSTGEPYDYFPVDLARYANMGFVDEVADDGKGGWLDMGWFDLCFFLTNHTERMNGTGAPIAVEDFPENTRFRGVPFKLTAPKKNNGKSVIALRGKDRAMKLPDKVTGIPVGKMTDKLWFIHGASYVPREKGVTIAKYVIHYDDGTSVDFPLRSGIEINDWSSAKKPEKAVVCWTGNNRNGNNYGLFLTEWENPHPVKVVKSIDAIGAVETSQLGVVGIAGGLKKKGASRTLAYWDFSKRPDGKIVDTVGGATLRVYKGKSATPMKVEELNGTKALNLNGRWFMGKLSAIKGFDPDKTYSTTIAFSLSELPEGVNGYSLLQFSNMRSGYRLFVSPPKHGRQLSLVYYAVPDAKHTALKGKTKLELNKFYKLKIVSGKSGVKLYLDGKLEAMKGSPGVIPYDGDILVGHCSGSSNLIGLLHSLRLEQK